MIFAVKNVPFHRRLIFSLRRLVHSFAYFLASVVALWLFLAVLMLAESAVYAMTGVSVSMWAMVIAALAAAWFFLPVVQFLQHLMDRLLFRQQLDTLHAIQALGVSDLASLPQEHVEMALLERIATICHRSNVVLDERNDDGTGRLFCYPKGSPVPPLHGQSSSFYELILPIQWQQGMAWLHLGSRTDGWPTDQDERRSLKSLANFAAISLEHARLSHQQSQQVRLDSISRVTGQLHSHDIKNRLHDLAFLAHHMESGKLEEDELKVLVGSIRKVVGRMETVMLRMADPNAPIHPKFQPCDLTALLKQQIDERLWPELIHLDCDLPPLPAIKGDAVLLQGVFENLFDNATQAMNKQGFLHIRAQQDEKNIMLSVRDEGNGMSDDFIKKRLFRLFSTSKEDGLGIGLYLSQRIIEAHNGQLFASSEGIGKGSTFWVVLPCFEYQEHEVSLP
ncbi:MAG: HAMP domain-containing sensor histidine kinase [Mariprofundaceae bacterium]|nr:HAMP domain-containing sensor histidine kinase [Mariprofundaceae bacterium]